MTQLKEIAVPDIGDFESVDIIEVLVAPGDVIRAEDPLVTLESDKATMDVPAPCAGTVIEIRIAVGDQVSEGNVILVLENADKKNGQSANTVVSTQIDEAAPVTASAQTDETEVLIGLG